VPVLAPARATSETRLEPGWRLQQEIGQSACPHAESRGRKGIAQIKRIGACPYR